MPRAHRAPRTQVLALPRPAPALGVEWVVTAVALAMLLAALLG
jgi:hypothetical protein